MKRREFLRHAAGGMGAAALLGSAGLAGERGLLGSPAWADRFGMTREARLAATGQSFHAVAEERCASAATTAEIKR